MAAERQPIASIAVAVEFDSGNVPLLLNELRHALERLLEEGTVHAIDLRAIPLAPGEEERLLAALGAGELSAVLDAQGRSEIRETAYPGIWCITHHDPAGTMIGRCIEVTFMPALLASQRPDVVQGLERLRNKL
ncbi:MAG TPA: hydrogenase expression/formation C-terminal domain-containing protein [Steroidobacteraceae bacterium]|nr:hydrogenase expression/formation C-terminal domain-containing protein [Steroidobacteraceae bacterium]